jgi:hypothetical protein
VTEPDELPGEEPEVDTDAPWETLTQEERDALDDEDLDEDGEADPDWYELPAAFAGLDEEEE